MAGFEDELPKKPRKKFARVFVVISASLWMVKLSTLYRTAVCNQYTTASSRDWWPDNRLSSPKIFDEPTRRNLHNDGDDLLPFSLITLQCLSKEYRKINAVKFDHHSALEDFRSRFESNRSALLEASWSSAMEVRSSCLPHELNIGLEQHWENRESCISFAASFNF